MFRGNTDDCFRVGISVTRKIAKLYTDFFKSDIIVASPLGLRTLIDGSKYVTSSCSNRQSSIH
jgi:U3 small nucleolar RNA-associated protein 25